MSDNALLSAGLARIRRGIEFEGGGPTRAAFIGEFDQALLADLESRGWVALDKQDALIVTRSGQLAELAF